MTRDEFYRDKALDELQWWVSLDADGTPRWVRVRVYADNSSDACWQRGQTMYACGTSRGIRGMMSETGYRWLADVLEIIEADIGDADLEGNQALVETLKRRAASLVPPEDWPDDPEALFLHSDDY